MFADPLAVTIDGSSKSLARISVKDQSSIYRTSDEKYTIKVSHQTTKSRTRRLIRMEQTKAGTNPLTQASMDAQVNVYLVIDAPSAATWGTGSGVQDVVEDLVGFVAGAITGASFSNLAKVLGSEI